MWWIIVRKRAGPQLHLRSSAVRAASGTLPYYRSKTVYTEGLSGAGGPGVARPGRLPTGGAGYPASKVHKPLRPTTSRDRRSPQGIVRSGSSASTSQAHHLPTRRNSRMGSSAAARAQQCCPPAQMFQLPGLLRSARKDACADQAFFAIHSCSCCPARIAMTPRKCQSVCQVPPPPQPEPCIARRYYPGTGNATEAEHGRSGGNSAEPESWPSQRPRVVATYDAGGGSRGGHRIRRPLQPDLQPRQHAGGAPAHGRRSGATQWKTADDPSLCAWCPLPLRVTRVPFPVSRVGAHQPAMQKLCVCFKMQSQMCAPAHLALLPIAMKSSSSGRCRPHSLIPTVSPL